MLRQVSKAGEEQGEMVLSLGARKNESELFGLAESVKTRRVSLRTALVRMGRLVVGQSGPHVDADLSASLSIQRCVAATPGSSLPGLRSEG